ncbi:MAG: 23S rRNA (adenine(2503)-C(2))-methyltransferase RlmN [Mariprofundaceae bacterium]
MSNSDLVNCMHQWHQPAYRAQQIRQWRNKGILDPAAMRNLPSPLVETLKQKLDCQPVLMMKRELSQDGTRKYLFTLKSGQMIETVFIPEPDRGTVCISSQVGCVFDCPFCHTGTQRFEKNLSAGEIVAQVLGVKFDLIDNPPTTGQFGMVTHVVYMGMGEPLANEDGLKGSLFSLMSQDNLHLSRRRITVSTSGIVPAMSRLGESYPVNLAVSLHAATDELRDRLVPINRKYPLASLRQCLDSYPLGKQRHITLEYLMLDGINDSKADLHALANFVQPARERVNLIHFNPYPGNPYHSTPRSRIDKFAEGLIQNGIRATVRKSRGQDIMAACGQLKAVSEKN